MDVRNVAARRPLMLGALCASASVALGLVYLGAAGAPARYLAVNLGALILGLASVALIGRIGAPTMRAAGVATAAIAGGLLATALLGDAAFGASRWVRVAGMSVQPSLVLLPPMLVLFARSRDSVSTLAVIAAAVALAIQPDRATAGMLALAMVVLMLLRPDRFVATVLAASVGSFAITLIRADGLPPVPFVDQILYTSFAVHPLAGASVLAGSALLVLPAILGWIGDRANRDAYAVFGAVWLATIAAAAFGNYPTPLVGYGGSAILGYALSLAVMPRPARAGAGQRFRSQTTGEVAASEARLPVALA